MGKDKGWKVMCDKCGYKARDSYVLKRHQSKHVPRENKCSFCRQVFPTEEEALKHKSYCNKFFSCFHCDMKFRDKDKLKAHVEKIHIAQKIQRAFGQYISKQCPLCSVTGSREKICIHLRVEHGQLLTEENREFNNEDAFWEWKEKLERSTQACFAINYTKKYEGKKKTIYFRCHRNSRNSFVPKKERQRHLKVSGSNKIDAFCPAYLRVACNKNGKVSMRCMTTHLGHDFSLRRLTLSKNFKNEIAAKLYMNIPMSEILDSVRKNVGDDKLSRDHLLTRKDLHNIIAQYNIPYYAETRKVVDDDAPQQTDYMSLRSWVEETNKAGSAFVRYVKYPEETDNDYPQLSNDEFVMILMSTAQLEMLKEYGKNVVCMDGTRNTNAYAYQLTTVLVLNEYKEGFPCAFMYSSRNDAEIMYFFLRIIADLSGPILTDVFMSELTNIYYNAWVNCFGSVTRHLYCSWYVDREWRLNLAKADVGYDMKKMIYNRLKFVQKQPNIDTFNEMFLLLLERLMNNQKTQIFGNYLYKHFSGNAQRWAYCYRLQCGVNTNMHLQRLHGILQYVYLKGKKFERLDACVRGLERMVRDKLFDRLISSNKGKLTKKIIYTRNRHKEAQQDMDSKVFAMANNEWAVSMPDKEDSCCSTVVFHITANCPDCKLICDLCQACIHMYSCTCIDNAVHGNMCKHIHMVHCSRTADMSSSVGQHIVLSDPTPINEECDVRAFSTQLNDLIFNELKNDNATTSSSLEQFNLNNSLNVKDPSSPISSSELLSTDEDDIECSTSVDIEPTKPERVKKLKARVITVPTDSNNVVLEINLSSSGELSDFDE